jgi:hypothetical protein
LLVTYRQARSNGQRTNTSSQGREDDPDEEGSQRGQK